VIARASVTTAASHAASRRAHGFFHTRTCSCSYSAVQAAEGAASGASYCIGSATSHSA
jgi:hypothetical protein